MPREVWECLMKPVVPSKDGGDWETVGPVETLNIEKEGLSQVDYLFGVEIPETYNWKVRTFALHSRCEVARIRFSYNVDMSILTFSATHRVVQ